MADIDIYGASFVSADMLFDGTELVSAAWGAHLANNTGYLAAQPVNLWSHHLPIGSDANASSWQGVSDFLFMAAGTWTIYYSMCGTFASPYQWNGYTHYFPDIYIDGSKYVTGDGTWSSKAGSFTIVSTGAPISVELKCDDAEDAERIAGYISLYGLREAGVLV